MARLEFRFRDLTAEGYEPATVVELIGSVDPDTLEAFEEMMDRLVEEQRYRVIFDLAHLKYINSTGMGMTVQFVDQLREEGGGLVLMKMQPKVLLVVEMLGLQELFDIVSTESDALLSLAGEEVGPHSIEVRLDEERETDLPEAVPVIEAEVPVIEPAEERVSLSGNVSCPSCNAVLAMPYAGVYRCPRCRSPLEVDENGQASAYPEPSNDITEMSVPAEDSYVGGVRRMVVLAGKDAGLSDGDAEAAGLSTEGCMRLLASAALNGSASERRLHVFLRPEAGKLVVRIYCGGKSLRSKTVLDSYRQAVDRLEYMASAQGNLVSIEKKQS